MEMGQYKNSRLSSLVEQLGFGFIRIQAIKLRSLSVKRFRNSKFLIVVRFSKTFTLYVWPNFDYLWMNIFDE